METGLIYLKVILMMRRITVIFFFGFSDEDVNKQTNKQTNQVFLSISRLFYIQEIK